VKDVETFCDVVGNQSEAPKTARNERVQALTDFGTVTGWQICPLPIDARVPHTNQTLGYHGSHLSG